MNTEITLLYTKINMGEKAKLSQFCLNEALSDRDVSCFNFKKIENFKTFEASNIIKICYIPTLYALYS